MHFDLNNTRFTVQIAPRALILDGQPCRAKLDRVRGIIWLSDQLPRNQRRLALFHELRHIWQDLHGLHADAEADADNSASFDDWLFDVYNGQGGDAALEALAPLPETSTARNTAGTGMLKCDPTCGYCHARILPGNIGTDAPVWNADQSVFVVMRGALCCVCDHVTVWHEQATADGVPRGEILQHPAPCVLTGEAAGEWIANHQRACQAICA